MLDSSSYPSDSRKASDSDLPPPRYKQSSGPRDSDSDLSPPRNRPRHGNSDSDLSPPRRKQRAKSSDSDLSPPRRSQPLGKKVRIFRSHIFSQSNSCLLALYKFQRSKPKQEEVALSSIVNLAHRTSRALFFSLKSGLPNPAQVNLQIADFLKSFCLYILSVP